jgi:hypothetical protein
MEGMGIASACESNNKPWILLKSICDFGDGEKGSTPDEEELKNKKQVAAAEAAAKTCLKALQTINMKLIVRDNINFFYRPETINIDKVFFLCYDLACKDYYLHREIDTYLEKHILTKSIWVSGRTGIGKSELLRHAIVEHHVKYIYVDLSLCDKENIDDMLITIYESICEFLGEHCERCNNNKEVTKKICAILESQTNISPLYILIEEIHFEETCENFKKFIQKLTGLIIHSSIFLKKNKVFFVISSIAVPKDVLDTYREKIQSQVYFVQLNQWTMKECLLLIEELCSIVKLIWSNDYTKEQFIIDMHYSPRLIKNLLKACCSLDYNYIDQKTVNKLKME